jgi:excisionase family DNA binding protein
VRFLNSAPIPYHLKPYTLNSRIILIMSEYLTIQEYAQLKGVSDRTIYRWIKSGDIKFQEINNRLHIKLDTDNDNPIDDTNDNENPVSEVDYLKTNIEYLQTQLAQALQTIDTMQQDRQRSDTIIAQLTSQLSDQTKLLEYHQQPFWRRWFNHSKPMTPIFNFKLTQEQI